MKSLIIILCILVGGCLVWGTLQAKDLDIKKIEISVVQELKGAINISTWKEGVKKDFDFDLIGIDVSFKIEEVRANTDETQFMVFGSATFTARCRNRFGALKQVVSVRDIVLLLSDTYTIKGFKILKVYPNKVIEIEQEV